MNRLVFATLATALVLSFPSHALAEVTAQEPERTFPISDTGRLSLENVNGDVTIQSWEKSEVSVIATKRGKTDAELKNIEIHVDAKPDWVKIETRYPHSGWFGNSGGSVDYIVKVPTSLALDGIELVNGDLTISGVSGSIKAETVNGSISAPDLAGNVALETVNGAIHASFARLDREQATSFETVNGEVEVKVPAGANADVTLETVNGRIRQDVGLSVDSKQIVGSTASGRIGAGGARLSLESVNGGLALVKH